MSFEVYRMYWQLFSMHNLILGYINPEILVNKIKMGQSIVGLKDSLTKMLCDLRLQVTIQDGCHDILVQDYFNLHEKLTRSQQRAICISSDNTCGLCRQDIVLKGNKNNNNNKKR